MEKQLFQRLVERTVVRLVWRLAVERMGVQLVGQLVEHSLEGLVEEPVQARKLPVHPSLRVKNRNSYKNDRTEQHQPRTWGHFIPHS